MADYSQYSDDGDYKSTSQHSWYEVEALSSCTELSETVSIYVYNTVNVQRISLTPQTGTGPSGVSQPCISRVRSRSPCGT